LLQEGGKAVVRLQYWHWFCADGSWVGAAQRKFL
jgi:hypothetical protein